MTSQQKAKKRHNFENLCERPIEIYSCQICFFNDTSLGIYFSGNIVKISV